ncbi:MAG: aminotransferase class I/II-fold pyridoxal phosphate-dependent enzyme [SAR324 cluster bacterium]|nr:aminotransferase class I/II-fold pyridoxal phosphate-dependent enzyme [SAR324 cluster bacterium]
MMISAAEFVQKAGAVAISQAEAECAKMAQAFDERRKFVLKRLAECGLDPGYYPTGAFYVFLRYPKKGIDSLSLAMDILEKAGVAITPGIDFGPGGEGFIRISYANSMEHLDTAISRLERYFFG